MCMTAPVVARAPAIGSVGGGRRRASADSRATTETVEPTIAIRGMASARAPWEGLGGTPVPRRRRSAPVDHSSVSVGGVARGTGPVKQIVGRVWRRVAHSWVPASAPDRCVDPSEWVPATPAPYATARSFLPSRGLVASTIVAIGAWAWVATCLQTVDPYSPYAVIAFLGGIAVGIAAVLAPALRVLATRYGRTRAFRDAAWWHGIRQGALVGLAVAVNGFLLAFRQWSPIGGAAVGVGAVAVEGIILAVLLSARGRPDTARN